jgi:hypothetical protein
VTLLPLAGCAANDDAAIDPNGNSIDAIRRTGQAGDVCGGSTRYAPLCTRGLTCVFPHDPPIPGEHGVCRTVSQEGGPCGGFVHYPAVCAAGLTCIGNRSIPDAPGTCEMDSAGGLGAECGGIAGLRCARGYTCVLESSTPDAGGRCHPIAQDGDACGGTALYPAVCATGLHCDGPTTTRPGATGTCHVEAPTTGCTTDSSCSALEYCERSSACSGSGHCAPRPDLCYALVSPVCGCDGRTYNNSCYAARAGVNVASPGACH